MVSNRRRFTSVVYDFEEFGEMEGIEPLVSNDTCKLFAVFLTKSAE